MWLLRKFYGNKDKALAVLNCKKLLVYEIIWAFSAVKINEKTERYEKVESSSTAEDAENKNSKSINLNHVIGKY